MNDHLIIAQDRYGLSFSIQRWTSWLRGRSVSSSYTATRVMGGYRYTTTARDWWSTLSAAHSVQTAADRLVRDCVRGDRAVAARSTSRWQDTNRVRGVVGGNVSLPPIIILGMHRSGTEEARNFAQSDGQYRETLAPEIPKKGRRTALRSSR